MSKLTVPRVQSSWPPPRRPRDPSCPARPEKEQEGLAITVTTTTETVQKGERRETRPHLLDLLLDGLEGAAIVALRDLLPCLREPVHRGRKALYTAARASRTFRLDDPPSFSKIPSFLSRSPNGCKVAVHQKNKKGHRFVIRDRSGVLTRDVKGGVGVKSTRAS